MKEYKNSNELLDYIISKGVSVNNKEDALNKIKTYSYYLIINTCKDVYKSLYFINTRLTNMKLNW